MSEHTEQASLVTWFNYQYPSLSDLLVASPNGAHLSGNAGQRSAQINKLKKEGFKKGFPDLQLCYPSKGCHGLFIEMKDKGKTQSSLTEEQKKYGLKLIDAGYRWRWAAGFEEAKTIIEEYLCDS